MSGNDPPTDREHTSNPADPHHGRKLPLSQSRRRLLQMVTSGSSLLLAGCGQGESNDGTRPAGTGTKQGTVSSHARDQTFRAPVDQNPSQISFYQFPHKSAYAVTPKERFSGRLKWIIREPGVWTDKRWVGGDIHYTWLEDIIITPTEVTVKIRDDATWSDGNPITGSDIAVGVMSGYIRKEFPAYFATDEKGGPTIGRDAVDAFNITDKTVTYRSSPGYFKKWWDLYLKHVFGRKEVVPTHIKPYDAYAEAVFETARRAQQGEINPWKGWNDPYVQPDDPHKDTIVEKYLDKEGKYVAKFSNPEHVLSTSAWNLVELSGPEAVFEPNPHHRNAENINFERAILEYTASEKRRRAALKADRLDYAVPGPTPQTIVEALPNTITQLQIPGRRGSGNELRLDFAHPALGNRNVRLALMYALDQSAIANNIHESAALPVTTPGGDCWDATDYVSEEWIDENLTTYPRDRDKAASLMRTAGYTNDGGQWIDADGEPLTLSLPTPNETPRWEPTVASQLTDFGIKMSVQTLTKAMFKVRVDEGKFAMWADSGLITSTADRTLAFWYGAAKNSKIYRIYPREQFETGKFSDQGAPVPRTEDRYEVFTIKAPPIGQPDGPLQEYHPSALAVGFFSQPPQAEFRHRVKTALWLANWVLPIIPINKTLVQYFIDDAHWQWPTDTPSWRTFTNAGSRSIDGIFASGTVQANPENPEGEAKQ